MNLQTQNRSPRNQEPQARSTLLDGAGTTADTPPVALPPNGVMVHHGIHRGRFPVAGLSVGEARAALSRLLNLDPASVAVINGRVVGEDETIGADVALVSFVKPSAVKG